MSEGSAAQQSLLSRQKLHELINSVSCGERLEPTVEIVLFKLKRESACVVF